MAARLEEEGLTAPNPLELAQPGLRVDARCAGDQVAGGI